MSTKYLRTVVDQLGGCLSALSPQAQRDLALRTGVGVGRSYSVSQVASMLGVSSADEGRIERSAVTTLEAAGQHSSCSGATSSISVSALPVAPGELVTIAGPQPGAADFVGAAETFAASHSNLSSSSSVRVGRHGQSSRSSVEAASATRPNANSPVQKAELSRSNSSIDAWTFGVLALLAVAILLVARRRIVERRLAVAAAVAPSVFATQTAPEANEAPAFSAASVSPETEQPTPEAWAPPALWSPPEPSKGPGEPSEGPAHASEGLVAPGPGTSPAAAHDQSSTPKPSSGAAGPKWLSGNRSRALVTLFTVGGAVRLLNRGRRAGRRRR